MAGAWDAARSWFESADAAEVRGDTDGAAAVAANAAEGKTGSDGCGFSAAGAAGGVCEIPGIARAAGEAVVGFVGHEKFGGVGGADDNRARRVEAIDDGCGARGNFVGAEKGASGVGPTCDVEATLYS